MKKLISLIIKKIPRKYLQRFSSVFLKVVSLFYIGKNVECNICEKKYRKFLPYGRVPRDNALCPNCLSLERHRLIWLYLTHKTEFFKVPLKMLHIAPELCFMKRFKKLSKLDYTTGDLESPWADVKMDIHQMPFDDDSFDVCFCNHVLEHVDNDILAMKEIYRILKPGGWAILNVPVYSAMEKTYEDPAIIDPIEREKAYGQDDHQRKYGRDYILRLKSAGFNAEQLSYYDEFSKEEVFKFGLMIGDDLYVCSKN
ncbi:MAG TPA: class I SAM-dependent methyltransferase [Cyclobacteriaceae bacterium]